MEDAKSKLCEALYNSKKKERDGFLSSQPFRSICRFIGEGVNPAQLSFFQTLDTFVDEYFDAPDLHHHFYLFARHLFERGAPATKETCQKILGRAFDISEQETLICLALITKTQPATFLLRFDREKTALHCAVERNYAEAALYLINDGAIELTAIDGIGWTAFQWAELFNNQTILDALTPPKPEMLGPLLPDSPIYSSRGSTRSKPNASYPEKLLPLTLGK